MDNVSGIVTSTVEMYQDVFSSYADQFMHWGQWLFYSCMVIAVVWLCLWRAFDHNSFQESMPHFIKEFFVIALFYTIMINAVPWLSSIVATATSMGTQLTHQQVDPSSIISNGIAISNLIVNAIKNTGILSIGIGILISGVAYIIVLAAFISVALDLAITIIKTSFLISISGLLLAFCPFPFTRQIARHSLDAVIGNSFKLLTQYTVIAAGSGIFEKIATVIPKDQINSFDIYAWVVAAALLFWLICKNIPLEVAKIVSHTIQENRGTDAAALAMSTIRYAQSAPARAALGAVMNIAKIAGSTAYTAGAHFNKASSSGSSIVGSAVSASAKTLKDLGNSTAGSLADHFKHIAKKISGGAGTHDSMKNIPGVAERMHKTAQSHSNSFDKSAQQNSTQNTNNTFGRKK